MVEVVEKDVVLVAVIRVELVVVVLVVDSEGLGEETCLNGVLRLFFFLLLEAFAKDTARSRIIKLKKRMNENFSAHPGLFEARTD